MLQMKKLIFVLLFCLVTGCALMIGNYDPVEYSYVNQIRTSAQLNKCSKPEVVGMYVNALLLKNYSQFLPDNTATINLVNQLYTIVDQLYTFDSPSPAYCQAKMKIIEETAERIQQVVGSKPR